MKKFLCMTMLMLAALTASAMAQTKAASPPEQDIGYQQAATLSQDGMTVYAIHSQPNIVDWQTPVMVAQDWQGRTVFCNPPYGRAIGAWVKKCYEESRKPNTKVVMLIPARTDTSYFHDYIYHKAELRFIRGRLKFGGSQQGAPFPSMVVVYG